MGTQNSRRGVLDRRYPGWPLVNLLPTSREGFRNLPCANLADCSDYNVHSSLYIVGLTVDAQELLNGIVEMRQRFPGQSTAALQDA
jgi:hypothetical protein